MWEAILTLVFFFILIISAFGADKYREIKEAEARLLNGEEDADKPVIEYKAMEIYRELIGEKKGEVSKDAETTEKRKKMK